MKKIISILIILLITSAITLISLYYIRYSESKNNNDAEENKEKEKIEEEKEIFPKTYKLSIVGTGDALLHNIVYKTAYVDANRYDFTDQLQYIKPIISQYDLAYYNAETIHGGPDLGYSSYPRFNTPQEFGDGMIDAGFNVISRANNHTMDKGEKGVLYADKYWETKDVLTAGSYKSEEERITPEIKEKNGITYSLLSYTMWDNGLKNPKGKEFYNVNYSDETAKADIERLRDKVDVLIVAIHWGHEYHNKPSEKQKEIAAYLASLDVDIIYGAHTHVLQPIEIIDDTVVYYSLGNFISSQIGDDRLTGVLASLDIIKTVNEDGSSDIELTNLNNQLIYTNKKDYAVYPYTEVTNDMFPNYIKTFNKNVEYLQSIDNTIPVMGIE